MIAMEPSAARRMWSISLAFMAVLLVFSLLVLCSRARADEDPWSVWAFQRQEYSRSHRVEQPHMRAYRAGRHAFRATYSGGSDLVSVARRYIGRGNFTGTHHAWCADAVNAWLARSGHRTTGSSAAISFARYGRPTAPRIGAIAVMRHHVGIVVGFNSRGPVLLSGNHGHRVGIGTYSARKIVAYRAPA